MTPELTALVESFQKHLYLPDPGPILVTLGTIAANRLPGDPVWLLLVGPPGNLKTEILQPTAGLDDVHPVGNITEAGLLSGVGSAERTSDATGGLLREIGDFGIILCKDFTSVLSSRRDTRAQVLAAFREIYDGSWIRVLGSDGGRSFEWQGKVGFIGGVTPVIDTHHAVMSTMGERFILYRMPELDEIRQAEAALDHASIGEQMRLDLSAAVEEFMTSTPRHDVDTDKTPEEIGHLTVLATFLARARSSAVRDGNSRQIDLFLPPETPGRIVIVLDRLRAGLMSIGVDRRAATGLVTTVAFDCMPVIRSALLRHMARHVDERFLLSDLANAAGHPRGTTLRHLEELEHYDLTRRNGRGPGLADEWFLSDLSREYLAVIEGRDPSTLDTRTATVPETSTPSLPDTVSEMSLITKNQRGHSGSGRGILRNPDDEVVK